MFDIDKESPFQPENPVSPEYFIGRQKIVKKILRQASKAKKGTVQHYFITGKKGMGKTSLAFFAAKMLKQYYGMHRVYVSNKGNDTLEGLLDLIIAALLAEIPKNSVKDKVQSWFGRHVESFEIKGAKITFKGDDYLHDNLKYSFEDFLLMLYKDIPNCNDGIFLIIDDINGLSKSKEFVDWYKRFVDTITVNETELPFYFFFAGYPERFQDLVLLDDSFARIFRYDEIDYLENDEIKEFYQTTFSQSGMLCSDNALNIMTVFSSGLPLMMQEIGNAVFWECNSNFIDEEDAINGIIEAGNLIGKRQIKPVLDKSIRSSNYENIFKKLGKNGVDFFVKSEFEEILSSPEKRVFPQFLKRACDLNILESVGKDKSGEYKFSNRLYLVYFMILNFKEESI